MKQIRVLGRDVLVITVPFVIFRMVEKRLTSVIACGPEGSKRLFRTVRFRMPGQPRLHAQLRNSVPGKFNSLAQSHKYVSIVREVIGYENKFHGKGWHDGV